MIELDFLRLLLAFICGYLLTLSGSLCQLVSNNSIASPSTLGMDGFAVIFVILAYFFPLFDVESMSFEHTSFLLFLGFFILLSSIFLKRKGFEANIWKEFNIQKVVLIGLAFNLLVGAVFSIIQFLFMALNIRFPSGLWFGSIKYGTVEYLAPILVIYFFIQLFLFFEIKGLEVLNLGKQMALSVGIKVDQVQKKSLMMALLCTGTVISYFGVFSFLGLIFPHILRSLPYFKKNMRKELYIGPYLTGFVFCLFDQFCYQFTLYGAELPVGMVSSVIGAVFLIFLLFKINISKL